MTLSVNYSHKLKRRKLRFAIVGAGAVAQHYLQAFQHCAEATVVAIADCRVEAAQTLAERARCRNYICFEQMAEDCELDAAIVCTPPASHPDICMRLLERRIHVVCEKPFSIDEQKARQMLESAQEAGVMLTMASKFRFVDDVIYAKSIVASGVLGDLIFCENVFAARVDMASRWNSNSTISGGGVIIDNGTHSVDLMRYFLGPLSEVYVVEGKRTQGLTVEETAALSIRSASGVICNINLSWSINPQRDSYFDIYGSRGAISIGWKRSSHLEFSHGRSVVFGHGYDKLQAFRRQIDNFSLAIRGEQDLMLSNEDILASVRTIESAYAALRENQWTVVSTS